MAACWQIFLAKAPKLMNKNQNPYQFNKYITLCKSTWLLWKTLYSTKKTTFRSFSFIFAFRCVARSLYTLIILRPIVLITLLHLVFNLHESLRLNKPSSQPLRYNVNAQLRISFTNYWEYRNPRSYNWIFTIQTQFILLSYVKLMRTAYKCQFALYTYIASLNYAQFIRAKMLILFTYLIFLSCAIICLNISYKAGSFDTAIDLPIKNLQNPLFDNIIGPHVLATYRTLCVSILLNAQEFCEHSMLSVVSFSVKWYFVIKWYLVIKW